MALTALVQQEYSTASRFLCGDVEEEEELEELWSLANDNMSSREDLEE
jgi:hypothetical protein